MKKNLFTIANVALLLWCSCQSTEQALNFNEYEGYSGHGDVVLDGYIESISVKTQIGTVVGPDEKTHKYAFWSKNDDVVAFSCNGTVKNKLVVEEFDKTYAKFALAENQEKWRGKIDYVLYPYQQEASISGSVITFNLPGKQYYRDGTFADGYNFAVSPVTQINDTVQNAHFKNICGYLKLSLTADEQNDFTVRKIKLTGYTTEKLCGTFTVDAASENPVATATATRSIGDATVVLDCGEEGVTLSQGDTTDFWFVVPVGSLAQGFHATVVSTIDERVNVDIEANGATSLAGKNAIRRSLVVNMPAKAVKSFPTATYDLWDYVASNGTAVINTGYKPYNSSRGGGKPADGIGIAMRGTMLSRKVDASTKEDNAVFCGVVGKYDTPYIPWITVDLHNNGRACRLSYNSMSFFPSIGNRTDIGSPFEVNYSFLQVNKKPYLILNNEAMDSGTWTSPSNLPSGELYLFGTHVQTPTTGVTDPYFKSQARIDYFKLYDSDRSAVMNWLPVQLKKDLTVGTRTYPKGTNGLYNYVDDTFTPNVNVNITFGLYNSTKKEDKTLGFTGYSIPGGEVVDVKKNLISIVVPQGTDISNLVASFTTDGCAVSVGGVGQISGASPNDFRYMVIYHLENNFRYNNITVQVTVADDPSVDRNLKFTSFEVPDGKIIGTIGNTMYMAFLPTANLENVAPQFTTTDGTLKVEVNGVEQKSGETSQNFRGEIQYRLIGDNNTYNTYTVKSMQYDIPVVFVSSPVKISNITHDDWVKNVSVSIFDCKDCSVTYLGVDAGATETNVNQIKGRGNTTWTNYPKKPYTFKLASKAKVLGMKKAKRWNLLANYVDASGIRNDIALQLGRVSEGLDWTPDGRFVELILNGKYNGNYYLCEHVQIDGNRIDIEAYDSEEPKAENAVGYLLEYDTYFDEVNKFRSALNFPVNVKDPDAVGFDLTYIRNWINTMEVYLASTATPIAGYDQLIDLDSFIDFWFVQEMVSNYEPNHPKSCYMYKDSENATDNKLHAGPLWDFDYGTFWANRSNAWVCREDGSVKYIYLQFLLRDPAFRARAQARWNAQVGKYAEVANIYIDSIAGPLANSIERDKAMWPYSFRAEEGSTYAERVWYVKNSLQKKISWMHQQINAGQFPAL